MGTPLGGAAVGVPGVQEATPSGESGVGGGAMMPPVLCGGEAPAAAVGGGGENAAVGGGPVGGGPAALPGGGGGSAASFSLSLASCASHCCGVMLPGIHACARTM